tara:strand:+ start:177 stop:497 length:321 start_codon:yes stop_codon:yes gene_type:complete
VVIGPRPLVLVTVEVSLYIPNHSQKTNLVDAQIVQSLRKWRVVIKKVIGGTSLSVILSVKRLNNKPRRVIVPRVSRPGILTVSMSVDGVKLVDAEQMVNSGILEPP